MQAATTIDWETVSGGRQYRQVWQVIKSTLPFIVPIGPANLLLTSKKGGQAAGVIV
jgi:hypothetical protein